MSNRTKSTRVVGHYANPEGVDGHLSNPRRGAGNSGLSSPLRPSPSSTIPGLPPQGVDDCVGKTLPPQKTLPSSTSFPLGYTTQAGVTPNTKSKSNWVVVPPKKGSLPQSPPKVTPKVPPKLSKKVKLPSTMSLPLGYTAQSASQSNPNDWVTVSPKIKNVSSPQLPQQVPPVCQKVTPSHSKSKSVQIVPPMFRPTDFPPLSNSGELRPKVKSASFPPKVKFSKSRKTSVQVKICPEAEVLTLPVVAPSSPLVLSLGSIPLPGSQVVPLGESVQVKPSTAVLHTPTVAQPVFLPKLPPVVFWSCGAPLMSMWDPCPMNFFYEEPPKDIDYRHRSAWAKPLYGLLGGANSPPPSPSMEQEKVKKSESPVVPPSPTVQSVQESPVPFLSRGKQMLVASAEKRLVQQLAQESAESLDIQAGRKRGGPVPSGWSRSHAAKRVLEEMQDQDTMSEVSRCSSPSAKCTTDSWQTQSSLETDDVTPSSKKARVIISNPQHTPSNVRRDLLRVFAVEGEDADLQEIPPQECSFNLSDPLILPPVNRPQSPVQKPPSVFSGSVNSVLFLGIVCQDEWYKAQLVEYFFLTPNGPPLTVRADRRAPDVSVISFVLKFVLDKWDTLMRRRLQNPVVTFKCREVVPGEMLFDFTDPGTTFIVTEGELPPALIPHSGNLWHCTGCQQGFMQSKRFDGHSKGTRKEFHKLLFEDSFKGKKSLGRSDCDKKDSIWALPVGHYVGGTVTQPTPQTGPPSGPAGQLPSESGSASPPPSSEPGPQRSPRFEHPQPETRTPQKTPRKGKVNPTVPKSVPSSAPQDVDKPEKVGVRKSARVAKRPAQDYEEPQLSGEEDISGSDDSGSQPAGSLSSSEFEFELDEEPRVKSNKKDTRKRGGVILRDPLPLTDGEDSDDDESDRKVNKLALREKMTHSLSEVYDLSDVWTPTDEDLALLKLHVGARVLMNMGLYKTKKNHMPIEVLEAIKKGEIPIGSEHAKYIGQTWSLYKGALSRLLGYIQASLLQNQPEKVSDGHLHVRQFFALNKDEWVLPPDVEQMLENFQSPSVKAFAHEGYSYLLKAIIRYISSPMGTAVFAIAHDPEERGYPAAKMMYKGRKKQKFYEGEIVSVLTNLKLYKPHTQYSGDRTGEANIFKMARKDIENKTVPDPKVVVPAFLEHEDSVKMEDLILEAAESKRVVDDNELDAMSEFLIIRILCLMGNRKDCLENMNWADYWKAYQKGFACWPFAKLPSNANPEGDDNKGDYMRTDPWSADPEDPEDMFCQDDEDPVWQGVRGYVAEILFHKTGASYNAYIFLNCIDMMFLKAYEEILANKLRAKFNGKRDLTTGHPIFVKSNGKPVLTKSSVPVMTMFCLRAGITNWTSYVFRYMYVKTIYNAKSALLKEAESFALCHGQKTAVANYMGDQHKKLLSLQANAFYRSEIQRHQEAVNVKEGLTVFSDKQNKRKKAALEKVDKEAFLLASSLEKRKDNVFKPYFRIVKEKSELVLLGEKQRVALVEMLFEGHRHGVSFKGLTPLHLLSGEPLKNIASGILLLRTFHSLPRSSHSVACLEENLLAFCQLLDEEEQPDLRLVETKWADKLLNVIHMISWRKHAPARLVLLDVFFRISQFFGGSYQYTCGNESLMNAMVHWHLMFKTKEIAREAQDEVVQPTLQLEEFRRQVEKLKETTQHTPKKAGALPSAEDLSHSHESDQEEVVHDVDIEVQDEPLEIKVESASKTHVSVTVRKTPAKGTRADVVWDDDFKLHLLQCYLQHAPDPALGLKPDKIGVRSAIEEQVVAFKDEKVYPGLSEAWRELGQLATKVDIIYRLGFQSQLPKGVKKGPKTGLLSVIHDYLQGEEQYLPPGSKVPLLVKSQVDEIIHFARNKYCKGPKK